MLSVIMHSLLSPETRGLCASAPSWLAITLSDSLLNPTPIPILPISPSSFLLSLSSPSSEQPPFLQKTASQGRLIYKTALSSPCFPCHYQRRIELRPSFSIIHLHHSAGIFITTYFGTSSLLVRRWIWMESRSQTKSILLLPLKWINAGVLNSHNSPIQLHTGISSKSLPFPSPKTPTSKQTPRACTSSAHKK